MKKFFNKILNLFFPSKLKCIFCKEDVKDFEHDPICDNCKKDEILNNSSKRCKICDQPFYGEGEICEFCKKNHKKFLKATAPFIYIGKVKNLVLRFKSDNAKYLSYPMAKLMAERLKSENMLDFDVIIPVPLSEKSLKKRGYNQALLLALDLGKIFGKPVLSDALVKIKETQHQKELNFTSRQKNLIHAFTTNNNKALKDKNILLVDDVLTTCATTSSCSEILQKYVNKIYVVAFARSILK